MNKKLLSKYWLGELLNISLFCLLSILVLKGLNYFFNSKEMIYSNLALIYLTVLSYLFFYRLGYGYIKKKLTTSPPQKSKENHISDYGKFALLSLNDYENVLDDYIAGQYTIKAEEPDTLSIIVYNHYRDIVKREQMVYHIKNTKSISLSVVFDFNDITIIL